MYQLSDCKSAGGAYVPFPVELLKIKLVLCCNNHFQPCLQAARLRGRRRACSGLVCASTGPAAAGGEGMAEQKGDLPLLARVDAFLSAFWKFLRPHTIRGTILGSFAVTSRALIESPVVSGAAAAMLLLACTWRKCWSFVHQCWHTAEKQHSPPAHPSKNYLCR